MWLISVFTWLIVIFLLAPFIYPLFAKREYTITKSEVRAIPVNNSSSKYAAIANRATSLANSTVQTVLSLDHIEAYKYLTLSDVTRLDTVLFSCFVLRALCIMSTDKVQAAEVFSKKYVSKILQLSSDKISSEFTPQDAENRFQYYDSVFARSKGVENKISALIEAFEFVILTDVSRNEFTYVFESSSTPLLGFDKLMQCSLETKLYFKYLLSVVNDQFDKTIELIQ